MANIKLIIAYDGTEYLGWQKTAMGNSIEQTLEATLAQILQHPVCLQAASRTDAGVHARGQVVNFFTEKEKIALDGLRISLNSLLPKDIAVLEASKMPETFHPTLDCSGKEYHYFICFGSAQLPQHRLYSWHYPHPLDIGVMKAAGDLIVGRRDFSSFCNFKKNASYKSFERNITAIAIEEFEEKRIRISIEGNSFLYRMARNIGGTLAYIGRGKLRVDDLPDILSSRDRTKAGMTAPAHGLWLHKVLY